MNQNFLCLILLMMTFGFLVGSQTETFWYVNHCCPQRSLQTSPRIIFYFSQMLFFGFQQLLDCVRHSTTSFPEKMMSVDPTCHTEFLRCTREAGLHSRSRCNGMECHVGLAELCWDLVEVLNDPPPSGQLKFHRF